MVKPGNFSEVLTVPAETINLLAMKKFGLILLTVIIMQGLYINLSAKNQSDTLQPPDTIDQNTILTVGNNLINVEKNDSSVNLKVHDRGFRILESLEGPRFLFEKYTNDNDNWRQDDNDNWHERRRRSSRFRGNWAGIELGFNSYLTSKSSMVMPADINYMTLNSGKSVNFNLNFCQLNLGITRHSGFVTGLGLNWNNYRFDGNNNIIKGADGVIGPLDPGANLDKSKLATLYLTLPFMLEIQIPVLYNHLNFAAGPIGAVKLASHSKMVFEDGQKIKSNGDFSLNLLRYGWTGRVGYGNFQVYSTYYMTPLFKNGKGPGNYNLYPFEIGISLTFNN